MIDTDLVDRVTNWLWVYIVEKHLLGEPAAILLGAVALICLEPLFRDWNKTVLYRMVVRRSRSAMVDVFFALLQSSGAVLFVEIAITFGISAGAARLGNAFSNYLTWRVTLPSDNVLEIAFSVMVY